MFKITAEEKRALLKRRRIQASVQMRIKVIAPGLKPWAFKDINEIPKKFGDEDIQGAKFAVLLDSVIVGYLDGEKVIEELYR